MSEARTALVTGATGYVGGNVVKQLLDDGWNVKVLARDADKAESRPWGDEVAVVEGDAGERGDVARALQGVDCAWYLLHSMDDGTGFAEEEADMARQFGEEAKRAGVGRIVYLGGLHPDQPKEAMSEHLASRVRVGEILMESGVPTAVLQAGVVIGAGSLSFQLLRHVTERVPAFNAPKWISNRITPIGVRDAAYYLVRAADLAPELNRTFDIGGPDSMPYVEMMERYAEAVGMRRRPYTTAPIMTRQLASWGLAQLTPLKYGQILPIFESVSVDTVVKERDLEELVGQPADGAQPFQEAVRDAARGTDPTWYGRVATPLHATALALAAAGGSWWLVPLNVSAAVVGTITAADDKEQSHSPGSAVAQTTATMVLATVAWRSGSRLVHAATTAAAADLARRAAKHSVVRAAALLPLAGASLLAVFRR